MKAPALTQVAIIGAGVASLAAARDLVTQGVAVTIYEKSGGVGGRVATRQVQGCIIDHGAQVVKALPLHLLHLATDTLAGPPPAPTAIGLPVWTFDAAGGISPGDPTLNAEPQWTWPTGINTLPKAMAAGLDIRLHTPIQHITATAQGYTLHNAAGNTLGTADAVLFTPPAPQTAAILAGSTLPRAVQATLLAELARATYRPCLSITLAYPQRPPVPWYALVNTDRQHPIAWLACEHAKPGHAPPETGLLIAQMAHNFSLKHWDAAEKGTYGRSDAPLPLYLPEVHARVQALVNTDLGSLLWANLQRWRYALPASSADFARLNRTDSGLFFAGDYLTGPGRVHLAIASGQQVAQLMLQRT